MRRLGVVALATAAVLTLGSLTGAAAAVAVPASAPSAAATTASVHPAYAPAALDAKKHKKKKKKKSKKKRAQVANTFANPSPAKKPTKKPAAPAKKPAAKPVATKPGVDGSLRGIDLARGNRESRNMLGWAPSLYTGQWFEPKVEPIRRCIMDRESNFSYRAVGAGTYFGAYQMNRNLANGALLRMEDEVRKEMGAEGVRILRALRTIAPNHWNRYWQDRAFYTIWNHGAGKGNWRGGGLNCF